jgi:hypothetical protein
MRNSLWVTLGALFAAIGAPNAHADNYSFTISGADSGSITITESGGTITGITGTFDGSTIASLLPAGGLVLNNDNSFTPAAPFLDGSGVGFSLSSPDSYGFSFIVLPSISPSQLESGQCPFLSPFVKCAGLGPDALTLVSTPQPSTCALMLLGIGSVLGIRKRKAQGPRPPSGQLKLSRGGGLSPSEVKTE